MHSHLPLRPVDKAGLLQRSECSASILNALIDKGVLIAEQVEINRFSAITPQKDVILPVLSEVQAKALHDIRTSMSARQVTLLRGVTGSGKTEIYSHLIADSLEHGDQVLFLVPEISLTTQLTTRLRLIFGDKLLVYHSKFSDNERVDIWHRLLHSQEPMVILGVRSSVFLPFARLGLIVIDEEHEASYKQYDPAPRYNARDAAIMLATMHGAKVLLGSATPSVETYYKAQSGKYGLVELLERYGSVKLPEVEIVDMRSQRKQKQNNGIFFCSAGKSPARHAGITAPGNYFSKQTGIRADGHMPRMWMDTQMYQLRCVSRISQTHQRTAVPLLWLFRHSARRMPGMRQQRARCVRLRH